MPETIRHFSYIIGMETLDQLKKLSTVQLSSKYRHDISVRNIIDEFTYFLSDAPMGQRIYHFKHDINSVQKCPYCERQRKYVKGVNYYITCCSKECKRKENSKANKLS